MTSFEEACEKLPMEVSAALMVLRDARASIQLTEFVYVPVGGAPIAIRNLNLHLLMIGDNPVTVTTEGMFS